MRGAVAGWSHPCGCAPSNYVRRYINRVTHEALPPSDDSASLLIALAPAWARTMYGNVINLLGDIMAKVIVEQDELDKVKADLTEVADDLEKELAQLDVPKGDLAGLEAIATRLRTDVVVPTPAPVPSPEPTPPPTGS